MTALEQRTMEAIGQFCRSNSNHGFNWKAYRAIVAAALLMRQPLVQVTEHPVNFVELAVKAADYLIAELQKTEQDAE